MPSVAITGAASGQGRATARRLARAGYAVAALDANAEGLASLAQELADAKVTTHSVDVTDSAAVEQVVERIATDVGLDGLLACAAINDFTATAEHDPSRWENVLRVNVIGVTNCVRACLPRFLDQGRGSIVIWGSVAAFAPTGGEAIYFASKAALKHLADCLRHEVAESGVKVGVLHPGMTQTPLLVASDMAAEALAASGITPLDPEDLARCAQFMLEQPEGCAISEMIVRPTRQVF